MTPAELLKRPVVRVENDFAPLVGYDYNFIPEAVPDSLAIHDFLSTESDRIEISVYKHHDFDHKRFWRLAAVRFDGEPVMITQNAGRHGEDHANRVLLSTSPYLDMCRFIAGLPRRPAPPRDTLSDEIVGMDEDLGEGLARFYGNELDGYFRPQGIRLY